MALAHRRCTRLDAYDYAAPGAYFVTVCTYHKEAILGAIAGDAVALSPAGVVVKEAWHDLPQHYPHIQLDAFVVMPNHVHGIIFLCESPLLASVGAGLRPAPTLPDSTAASQRHGLSEVIRAFKSFSARRINTLRGFPGAPAWQRGFYDHVIRSDEDLARVREYIATNLLRWALDEENPGHPKRP